jgi:hypothetical protein
MVIVKQGSFADTDSDSSIASIMQRLPGAMGTHCQWLEQLMGVICREVLIILEDIPAEYLQHDHGNPYTITEGEFQKFVQIQQERGSIADSFGSNMLLYLLKPLRELFILKRKLRPPCSVFVSSVLCWLEEVGL